MAKSKIDPRHKTQDPGPKEQTTSESPKGQSTMIDAMLEELEMLLAGELELAGKLKEALETERFFITVTFQKKYNPDDEHDLHHYYCRKNIMVNDVVPCLKYIASNFIAKENPTAEVPDKSQWH